MVAAGLTAATPHMISASINALSRLLFEFKGESSSCSVFIPLSHIPLRPFCALQATCYRSCAESPLAGCSSPSPRPLGRSLTHRLHLNLNNLGTSSHNNRIPTIEKPRNRQIRPRFRKSRNSSPTPRRNNSPPTSSSPSITRLGTRS
jgi:hypothetical protein